ncbi:hypothetical protein EVAR_97522_1 [Eumeta japonica]|uniref:Uncharacterized protein n=1 Tax=Eumeta variegata TaxID=151549 RepID=A0A4C1WNH4_EUMVA|nr:hypothetical protein EVAR_97522_1 [Eumeta japonica]
MTDVSITVIVAPVALAPVRVLYPGVCCRLAYPLGMPDEPTRHNSCRLASSRWNPIRDKYLLCGLRTTRLTLARSSTRQARCERVCRSPLRLVQYADRFAIIISFYLKHFNEFSPKKRHVSAGAGAPETNRPVVRAGRPITDAPARPADAIVYPADLASV